MLRAAWVLLHGPHGGDLDAMDFWAAPPEWVAAGSTPDEAIANLRRSRLRVPWYASAKAIGDETMAGSMRRAGRGAALALGMGLWSAAPGVAEGTPGAPGTEFVLAAPASWNHDEQTARRGAPLLTLPLQPTRAVRLGGPVTVTVAYLGHIKLKAGDTLFAVPDTGLYCGGARGGTTMGNYFPCLADTDGDGAFDTQNWGGRARFVSEQRLGPTTSGELTDFAVSGGRGAHLAQPVPFTAIDAQLGPAANLQFLWRAKAPRAGSGGPTVVSVWVYAGVTDGGAAIGGDPRETPLDADGRGRLEVGGVLFSIAGLNADGSLRYRILQLPPPHTVHIPPPGVRNTITIYM